MATIKRPYSYLTNEHFTTPVSHQLKKRPCVRPNWPNHTVGDWHKNSQCPDAEETSCAMECAVSNTNIYSDNVTTSSFGTGQTGCIVKRDSVPRSFSLDFAHKSTATNIQTSAGNHLQTVSAGNHLQVASAGNQLQATGAGNHLQADSAGNNFQADRNNPPSLFGCLRCQAGEPGHIGHICR